MHDGNHGSYSKNKLINKLMGLTLNLVGGSAKNWRIQHNKLHHTFTNVHEMDPDVSPLPMLRFSPKAKLLLFININIFMHGSFMVYFHFHGQLLKNLFSYLNLKKKVT